MIRVGDTVEYASWSKATVKNIYLISSGEFVNETRYGNNGYDIMLVLNDAAGSFNVCFKDRPDVTR